MRRYRVAQKGITDTMDPLPMVQGSILSTRTSICVTHFYMTGGPSGGGQRIACLREQLASLTRAESQMQAIDRQYATDIARALGEKSRIYMAVMREGSCN